MSSKFFVLHLFLKLLNKKIANIFSLSLFINEVVLTSKYISLLMKLLGY